MKRFFAASLLYLIPTAIYVAWRLYWVGFELGYSESTSIGFFMVNNLASLVKLPFSPWLDGIPVRLLVLAGVALLFFARMGWRTRLLLLGFIVLPVLTVLNLPPRSNYAYAALPGAALLFSAGAGSLRGRAGLCAVSVILLGCFLAARDELSRFRQADSYTRSVIERLADLERSTGNDAMIFVSGIRSDVAGYGTVWPGAYIEALSTIGAEGSGVFGESSFWEQVWPVIDAGGDPECLFARFSDDSTDVLPFWPSTRTCQSPCDSSMSIGNGAIAVSDDLWMMNSCATTGRCRLFVSDPFDEASWIEISPCEILGDTTLYDLESSPAWLLSRHADAYMHVSGLDGGTSLRFTRERLWLEPLLERLEQKAEAASNRGLAEI
ncbi:MAG: hypothetical protein QUS11_08910 [Candidatus Fermentibacter sp.]|nr:hypothetical protein [Candidatus Fermentibacter sp.]